MESVIYEIRNTVTDKVYIGQTTQFSKRKYNHFYCLKKGNHGNKHLQSSFNKYGEKAFEINIILLTTEDNLDKFEALFIEKRGHYNLTDGGEYNTRGYRFTEEQKDKIANSLKDFYNKNPNPMEGKSHKESSIEKMSERRKDYASKNPDMVKPLRDWVEENGHPNKGKTLSKEVKSKISKGKKLFYENLSSQEVFNLMEPLRKYAEENDNPFKGKEHTKETKEHLSKINKDLLEKDPQRLDKLFEGRKEYIKNTGGSFKNKTHKTKSKEKMSKAKVVYKDIKQIDPKTNKVIKVHKNAPKAMEYIGMKGKMTSNIAKVLRGEQNTAYGYKWEV